MVCERVDEEVVQNVRILREARRALRLGAVDYPLPFFPPIPLTTKGREVVEEIVHSCHERQVELQKSVILLPHILSEI